MKQNFARWMISLFIMVFISSCKKSGDEIATQGLPHTKKYPADVVTSWFSLLADISRNKPYVPAPTFRIFAYSGMALYESVVPGMPSYQSMYKYLTGNEIPVAKKNDYYWPACANAAIARIATRIMQDYPAPNLTSMQALEATLNASFENKVTAEQLQLSNDFGRFVADIIYDWSKTDRTLNPDGTLAVCPTYVPLAGPGNWVPTPPGFFTAAGACQGSLNPFIPRVAERALALSQPPPAYSTDPNSDFYRMAKEIYDISLNVTQDDINISQNWRDRVGTNYNGPARFTKLLTGFIKKENLSLEEAALLYIKNGIAVSDAVIATFRAKFHYKLIRPVTYIHNIMGHTSWTGVYAAPQHPSYMSVSSATAGAFAEIIEANFGANYSFTDSLHHSLYGSWTYNSIQDFVRDGIRSRTHSGINFKQACEEGVRMGKNVGSWVNALPFKK
jgi:hypothetical protein